MQKRFKSAITVFLFLAIAFAAVFLFDYTDTYVSDRFHKALASEQYVKGDPFSLDAFLEYYDWDTVCVALPFSEHEFQTRLGRHYTHGAQDHDHWSLVFVKEDYVIAEIVVDRAVLEYPNNLVDTCFNRWSAIVSVDDNEEATDADLRLSFTGV